MQDEDTTQPPIEDDEQLDATETCSMSSSAVLTEEQKTEEQKTEVSSEEGSYEVIKHNGLHLFPTS